MRINTLITKLDACKFLFLVGSENNLTTFIKRPQRPESGPQPVKGIASDFLTTSFYDIHQKILTKKGYFKNFSFPILRLQVTDDYVHWHCSMDYCVKSSLVDKTMPKLALIS